MRSTRQVGDAAGEPEPVPRRVPSPGPKAVRPTVTADTADSTDAEAAKPAEAKPAEATEMKAASGVSAVPVARSRRVRGGAVLLRLGVVVLVLAVAGAGIWLVTRATTPEASPTTTEIPALEVEAVPVQPGSIAPVNATVGGNPVAAPASGAPKKKQQQSAGNGRNLLAQWAGQAAAVTGIPARALFAYGNAEVTMRGVQPDCRISWATLAGIGRIESNHGQYGGAVLGEDGRPSKPIIGVPLDGSPGVRAISDTDGGRYDGDPTNDRAVGPMQFIPSTWAKWASDGNGDGLGDPQQIDDVTLGAARYLCAGGRNMADPQGWWSGIMSYNNSVEYAQKVFGLADSYAKSAQAVRVQG